jgi:hypothetical protein
MTAPGGSRIAITSLNQVEDKLRRNLNLAGDVGLQFGPDLKPVVISSDATTIGNATYRGRRFLGGVVIAGAGAAWSSAVKAADDLVIDGIRWNTTGVAGTHLNWRLSTGREADPYTISTPFAMWSERAQSVTDLAPLLISATPAAASTLGNIVWSASSSSPNVAQLFDEPIFLAKGDRLVFQTTDTGNTYRVNFSGYIF